MNIIDELLDLKKSFINEQDYKGYMVKQVIDARLRADEVRSDLVASDSKPPHRPANPPKATQSDKEHNTTDRINEALEPLMIAVGESKEERRDDTQSFMSDAVDRITHLIAEETNAARIDEMDYWFSSEVNLNYRPINPDTVAARKASLKANKEHHDTA